MHARGTAAIPLAPSPSLEYYRKLSKDLLAAVRGGDPEEVRAWAARWIERLASLQEQSSTPQYVVGRTRQISRRRIDNEVRDVLTCAKDARLLGGGTAPQLSDAQYFIAWLHGFESWPKLVTHLEAIQVTGSPISLFEAAADAVVTGDEAALQRLLREHADLARRRSSRDHHATLLHYIAANGHEGFRQLTPPNAMEIARLLLDAGSEPDAEADMYEHPCTTMQMLVSSVHPHKAGVQAALVELLCRYGASPDGVGKTGSPLMTAFRFHYPLAADALVRCGAAVDNIITAAALGRMDLVEEYLDDQGHLRPGVRLAEGPWPRLTKDPKIHLSYALTWAATWGRTEVVERMLRKGVDPRAQDDDAGAIHFAAAYGHLPIVRLLVRHGASLEQLNSYGGTVLSGTLWFAFNDPVPGVDYAAVVGELLELGARPDHYPEMPGHVDVVLAGRRGGGYPGV